MNAFIKVPCLVLLVISNWHGLNDAQAEKTNASMSLKTNGNRVVMDNRVIELVINKDTGAIHKLFYKGKNMIGDRGRGYIQAYDENGFMSPEQCEMIIARNDNEVMDIGFNHQHEFAVDYEWHYVLRPGESGFYNYIVWGFKADEPGEHRIAQLNYVLRLAPSIFTHFDDGANTGALPTTGVLGAGTPIMDATYRLANGTVYTKYNHAANMDENHRVHGLMGAVFGAWCIMPSHEHLNSVPFNAELTVHQTDKTPLLLRHVQAAHHGSGIAEFSDKDGPWEKWGGPWYFYFNHGKPMANLEKDAQQLATKMVEQWPFQWIKDERFATERGTLRGQLVDRDGKPMAHARVVITQAAKGDKPGDFQQQWRGYRFFGWTDAEGRFELKNVWPDTYDFYAMQKDVAGRFAKYDIRVAANETTDVGTLNWETPIRGEQLWQMGTLDRSAAEFGHGDDYRHWGLWMKIQKEFPDGIVVVDADRGTASEIPFILAAYVKEDGAYYDPVLKIDFTLTGTPAGKTARLLFAIAEARGPGGFADLSLALNGEALAEITKKFKAGGAIHRSGIRGHCQETTITFPGSQLKAGNNTLEIKLNPNRKPGNTPSSAPHIAIMFDAIRLELFEN